MKKIFLAIISLSLAIGASYARGAKKDAGALANSIDSVSYALGINIGMSLQEQFKQLPVDNINTAAFCEALKYTLDKDTANLKIKASDAGTVVNATGNYVNAYDGSTTNFDGVNTLSGELKTFYDTELLENARVEMFYAQFAKKQPLPKKHGGTVEWRKFNTFKKASKLIEGVIPEGQKGGTTVKTGFISQYGTYVAVTDVLEMRAYDSNSLGYYNA